MFCPMCGAPNEDTDEFCGNCGAALRPGEVVVDGPVQTVDEAADVTAEAEAVEAAAGEIEVKAGEEQWPEPSLEEAAPAFVPAAELPIAPLPPQPAYRPGPQEAVPSAPTSGLAIASLVLGIGGLTILPLIGSALAIIFGYMARRDIRQRPGELTGGGMAMAGIVMGWIAVGLAVLGLLLGLGIGVCSLCGALGSGNF